MINPKLGDFNFFEIQLFKVWSRKESTIWWENFITLFIPNLLNEKLSPIVRGNARPKRDLLSRTLESVSINENLLIFLEDPFGIQRIILSRKWQISPILLFLCITFNIKGLMALLRWAKLRICQKVWKWCARQRFNSTLFCDWVEYIRSVDLGQPKRLFDQSAHVGKRSLDCRICSALELNLE